MPDIEKVINQIDVDIQRAERTGEMLVYVGLKTAKDALAQLKEQEDSIRILISDLEDLQKEHDKLLDKKIPLITNGQEVVRCKDCKHWSEEFDRNCLKRSGWFRTTPDWFCADGEHKEGR